MPLKFSLGRILWTLWSLFVLLALAGVASELSIYVFHDEWGFGLVPLVNLGFEGNIPTWYSSSLLLACAALLAIIARARFSTTEAYRRHWAILAAIFLYLSIDESAVIHELINEPLNQAFELGSLLHFAWILPFGILVFIFLLSYLGFLRHLPMRFRLLFVVAGAIYVGGAAGTELPISFWYDRHGGDNLVYGLLNVGQETLEILGATIFGSSLLSYIRTELGVLQFVLTTPEQKS